MTGVQLLSNMFKKKKKENNTYINKKIKLFLLIHRMMAELRGKSKFCFTASTKITSQVQSAQKIQLHKGELKSQQIWSPESLGGTFLSFEVCLFPFHSSSLFPTPVYLQATTEYM